MTRKLNEEFFYLCSMAYPLLAQISSPEDFRHFSLAELRALSDELRRAIIDVVALREGHLGASLGVVELTLALHWVFDTPNDRLVWDVGHQAYGHKMLTGRLDAFSRLRQWQGLSGFPQRDESPYDSFGTGHSSTSLSAVLGMALAARQQGIDRHHIAVIGDASIASGMAFEALNHLGTTNANVLIVLNDNAMGIDPSVGALKHFFAQATPPHTETNVFQPLNIPYWGPVDGHDLDALGSALQTLQKKTGPRLLHVRTKKGKGLTVAEQNQIQFHAPGKFDPVTGKLNAPSQPGRTKYQTVVGQTLEALMDEKAELMAITPAMPTGSGLVELMRRFPTRCLDVGIAEQHAVTLAAGMAAEGLRPFCVIYSTFLQRAYDQVIHDVALQQLPVVFLIDRAGIVGHDGPTHHGLYDIAYLRTIPGIQIWAPHNAMTLRQYMAAAAQLPLQGPVAIRYPRGYIAQEKWEAPLHPVQAPALSCLQKGDRYLVISIGATAHAVQLAIDACPSLSIAHYDLGAIKPLDESGLHALFGQYHRIVTVEDGAVEGGAGQALLAWAHAQGYTQCRFRLVGVPDTFVGFGKPAVIHQHLGLDPKGLAQTFNHHFVQ